MLIQEPEDYCLEQVYFPVDSLEGEGLAKGGEGGQKLKVRRRSDIRSEGAGDDFKEGAFGGALGVA